MNINRLHSLLNNGKYTKVALAAKCGVSRVTIDNLLNGSDVKISTMEAVANAFNVPVSYFFEDDQNNNNNISHVKGNNNILSAGGNNNVTFHSQAECEKEVEHLKAIIEEKERLIQVLMKSNRD